MLFSYFRITFYAMNSIPDKGVSKTFVRYAVFWISEEIFSSESILRKNNTREKKRSGTLWKI